MDNSKFFKIIIIILLVINMATLAFMWSTNARHARPPMGHDVGEFLSNELKFSKDQQAQFELMKKAHQSKVKGLRDKNKEFHDSFFDLLSLSTIDSVQVSNAVDSIIYTQKQIEMATFYHFKEVRTICSSEQKEKFDEVINEALRMMSPMQQGPSGGHPNGPPPFR